MALSVARKTQPAIVLPEQVREQLAAAQAEYARLTILQSELAEQSITDPAAERRYHETIRELVATDGEMKRLETALASMETKAAEALTRQQAGQQAALRDRVKAILAERIEVANAFTEHLTLLVEDFRQLSDLSDKAYMAFPGAQPQGAALGNAELVQLIAAEMFRQGGVAPITGRIPVGRGIPSLPAPKAPSLEFLGQPEAIRPLVAAIEDANRLAISVMERKNG